MKTVYFFVIVLIVAFISSISKPKFTDMQFEKIINIQKPVDDSMPYLINEYERTCLLKSPLDDSMPVVNTNTDLNL